MGGEVKKKYARGIAILLAAMAVLAILANTYGCQNECTQAAIMAPRARFVETTKRPFSATIKVAVDASKTGETGILEVVSLQDVMAQTELPVPEPLQALPIITGGEYELEFLKLTPKGFYVLTVIPRTDSGLRGEPASLGFVTEAYTPSLVIEKPEVTEVTSAQVLVKFGLNKAAEWEIWVKEEGRPTFKKAESGGTRGAGSIEKVIVIGEPENDGLIYVVATDVDPNHVGTPIKTPDMAYHTGVTIQAEIKPTNGGGVFATWTSSQPLVFAEIRCVLENAAKQDGSWTAGDPLAGDFTGTLELLPGRLTSGKRYACRVWGITKENKQEVSHYKRIDT